MSLLKRGGDQMWNGMVVGAIMGVLVASSEIGFLHSIVTSVMGAIPTNYLSWAGAYASYAVFGLIGLLIGYWADYK